MISAGRVGRPHGLDGSFRVTRPVVALLKVGAPVTVGGRATKVIRRAGTDAAPIVRVEGVVDRAACEALRGEELLVGAGDLPATEPDEWYAHELEGCAVVDGPVAVGRVVGLLELPSVEALEVWREGHEELLLVPLVRDCVRSIDVAGRVIDVSLAFLGEG